MPHTDDTEDIVGVITMYRNKILLVRGETGKWSLPKGKRRINETSIEGALREAREEAGIDLSNRNPITNIRLYHGLYYIYDLMHIPSLKAPETPEEILEIGWFSWQTIRHQEMNADLKLYYSLRKKGRLPKKTLYKDCVPVAIDTGVSAEPPAKKAKYE